ncbi:MAG: 3-deoxy-D-manno-octulosonic acid transferase [Cytophagales bacterium]
MLAYNIGILFYGFLIIIASKFSEKAKLWMQGRKGIFDKMHQEMCNIKGDILWFHCASLGEFEQGRPIIEKIKVLHPQYKILLTFFSPSGFEVRKHYEKADFVYYLPLDTAINARKFIEIAKPKMAFFVKYEFWFHYLTALKKSDIPVYSVSSIFRPNQIFFKPYGKFYRNMLGLISRFFVQNTESEVLLKSIGIESKVTGDTRFDRVNAGLQTKKDLLYIKRFKKDSRLFVIGSSWKEDLDVLAESINDFYLDKSTIGNIKVVIAPHEISTKNIQYIQNKIQRPILLYSDLQKKDLSLFDILVIDNVGMLSSIYAYADFAYVGGGFGKGLHNILEAAVYGMPIFFGSKYEKFQEAVDLVAQGGAFSISSSETFETKFKQIASDQFYFDQCKSVTTNYVQRNVGATDKILKHLNLL